jgi:tRNA (mo5U34)-methyltransferase
VPGTFFDGCRFHQRWEIFEGVHTPGVNDIADICRRLEVPEDLSGRRVLDVGAWNGCLSFECERRGAAEVIALGPEDPEQTGFTKMRALLGSRVQYRAGSVYDLDPDVLGTFDVVMFWGVLYHLRYPLLGIDNLRRVCRGEVFVETHVCEDLVFQGPVAAVRPWLLRRTSPVLATAPLWLFYRTTEMASDPSNWFGPNRRAVIAAFESAGFETRLVAEWPGRAGFRARARPGQPEFLTLCCGESHYYDTLVRHLFGGKRFAAPEPVAPTA